MNPYNMVLCVTHQWTIAVIDLLRVRTTGSKLIITALKRAVIKCTFQLLMCKCMPTITGRIALSYKKVSKDLGLPKSAELVTVPSSGKGQRTFTAEGQAASLHSRIRLIWVSNVHKF